MTVQIGGHRVPAISKTRLPAAPYVCGLIITLPSFFARVTLPPTRWIGLIVLRDALLALPVAHLGISRLQVRYTLPLYNPPCWQPVSCESQAKIDVRECC